MKVDESDTASNALRVHKSPQPDRSSTLLLLEGFELVQAFSKIGARENRQKVIDLAKRLSTTSA
jgi:hypothetical protein